MLATRSRQTHLRASLRVMAPTRLTVVLVGQTGNGKSATGNSLLGRDAFVARRSLQSITERCRVRYAALDADDEPIVPGDPAVGIDEDAGGIRRPSTVLRVVDTPGTCDSGALLEDNLRHISAFLRGEERVDESTAADDDDDDGAEAGAGDEGLHALVLVLSAATRFTQEEAVALERLVQRLGEGVMRHSVAIFTRGGELAADDVRVDDFVRSAPPTLRQLLARMGHHAHGTPPILVENAPRDGSSRAATARAPLLTAVRELVKRVAAEKGCDENQATYDAKALTAASDAADADPSTAALAVLDKLKRQMASGPMAAGGGGGTDPRRSAMAEAAMRAFSDLQAQFAARAGAGSVAAPAVPRNPGCGVFGGFGASSVGDRVTDRVVDREWTEWTNALADGGDGDAAGGPSLTVGLRGAGDVHADTACAVHFAGGTCLLRFRAPVECGDGKDPVGRFRSSGRVSAVGDGGFIVSASVPVGSNVGSDAPAVTFHSPVFLQGPCHYAPTNTIVTDDDWVEEGVYKCELAPCSDPFPAPFAKDFFTDDDDEPPTHGRLDGPRVVCMLRGVKPGDAVNVRAMVGRKGTRFELQGGSMSLRACDFAMKTLRGGESASDFSFAVDGVLDLTPGVHMALGARVSQDPTENTTVQIPKGFEWPWKRGEPGRKPGQGDPSK